MLLVFGIKIKEGRPAVNVGSDKDPVWYAQEALRIIPYQMYTRPVPDSLTGAMVQKAAYHPSQSQWLIENEGLRQMGFNIVQNNAVSMVSLLKQLGTANY
jgi:eukaryotic translation initiation factor 2C